MEELLAGSKIELLKEGSVITGTIMEIRPTEVVIDFGGKAEGTIPAHEFLDLGDLEIGSDLEVFLERLEDRDVIHNSLLIKQSKRRIGRKLLIPVKKVLSLLDVYVPRLKAVWSLILE